MAFDKSPGEICDGKRHKSFIFLVEPTRPLISSSAGDGQLDIIYEYDEAVRVPLLRAAFGSACQTLTESFFACEEVSQKLSVPKSRPGEQGRRIIACSSRCEIALPLRACHLVRTAESGGRRAEGCGAGAPPRPGVQRMGPRGQGTLGLAYAAMQQFGIWISTLRDADACTRVVGDRKSETTRRIQEVDSIDQSGIPVGLEDSTVLPPTHLSDH